MFYFSGVFMITYLFDSFYLMSKVEYFFLFLWDVNTVANETGDKYPYI